MARWCTAVIAAVALVGVSVAQAEPTPISTTTPKKHQVHWDPAWSHANAWDYTVTGIAGTAAVIELTYFQNINPPLRWSGPILFDSGVRDAMRVDTNTGKALETTAWVLWGLQFAYPIVVDVPFAWARHGKQLAWDLLWQDAVTLSLAGAVDGMLRDFAGRARPDIYECLQAGGTHCLDSPEATRSFPGGHFANSTAASVLTCTQHLYMRLYGGPWDGLTCALTLTSNVTLGVFRIMSDNHWVTDQIVGGAIGGLIGFGVPYIMHLHAHTAPDRGPPSAMLVPMPMTFDHGGGFGMMGIF